MKRETLRTSEVAASAGVNAQTLRYYERRGLLPEPERARSGYREYPPESVRLIRFIKKAQELGFTLTEVEELLALRDATDRSRAEVRAMAEAKVTDVEGKIRQLRAMKRALVTLVKSCACGGTRECPILEALDDSTTERRSLDVVE